MTDEDLTPEQARDAGLWVFDKVEGEPPPYDVEEARRLLREGDPLALEPDPDC